MKYALAYYLISISASFKKFCNVLATYAFVMCLLAVTGFIVHHGLRPAKPEVYGMIVTLLQFSFFGTIISQIFAVLIPDKQDLLVITGLSLAGESIDDLTGIPPALIKMIKGGIDNLNNKLQEGNGE